MNINAALSALAHDTQLQAALVLIAVDFVLGVAAALKTNTFRLSYVGDFARNDVIQKLVPWATLYIAAKFAPNEGIGPLDLGFAAGAVYALIVAAWAGSIMNSISELGFTIPSRAVAGSENVDAPATPVRTGR